MIHGEARIANVVLDIGSYHTFAGEAGLQNPPFCSHSYLVEPNLHKKQQYLAGQENLDSENTNKQIVSIFEDMGPEGKVNKFHFKIDKFDKFIQTILMDNLELDNCSISLLIAEDMSVELQPSEVLKQRQKILDYLFQGMQISNIAFIKKPVLSAFALGRSTATVLDSGHSFSHCSIIEDGYCVYNQTVRFGGSLIHSLIRSQIDQKSKLGKNWKIGLQNSSQSFKQSDLDFHKLIELEKIIRKFPSVPLKSTMVSQEFEVTYTLPDGQNIQINRSNIPDPFVNFTKFWQKFFQNCSNELPNYLNNQSFFKVMNSFRGLERFVYDTISQYLVNLDQKNHTCYPSSHEGRKKGNQLSEQDMLNNIILTGGNLSFSDLSNKIYEGVRKRGGNVVQSPLQFNKDSEGRNCSNTNSLSWIGGSIVSNVQIMNHFWIKLPEWKQLGSYLATSKSLANELIKNTHASETEQQAKRNKKLELITKKCA